MMRSPAIPVYKYIPDFALKERQAAPPSLVPVPASASSREYEPRRRHRQMVASDAFEMLGPSNRTHSHEHLIIPASDE